MAAHSSGGQVAARLPSGGWAIPTRRSVAAGLPARTGLTPARRLVEDEPERVEVAALVDALARRLLRGHVGERAHDVARARERLVAGEVGDAEVGQLGRAVGRARAVGDHHVLRLDVAVDDAALVGVLERVGEREPDPQHVAVGDLAGGLELRQRAAAHELGDEEARAVLLAGVEDGDDPGVVEAGDGVGLAAGAVVGAAVGGDRLDRHGAPEALVARLVDRAEAARADARTQSVAPQGERRVGLSDELFGGLHGERSFAAAEHATFTPQRRLRAVAPPRRAYFTPCPSSTRTTSRAEQSAPAPKRGDGRPVR